MKAVPDKLQTIHNALPENRLFDEALLGLSYGHCQFDSEGKLEFWSDNFADLYVEIKEYIQAGLPYRSWLHLLIKHSAIANLPEFDDVDKWLDRQVEQLGTGQIEFVHHLNDGRKIQIKYVPLSTGANFFAAFNITSEFDAREASEISSRKFRSFAQLASDWFWELDENLVYHYHSEHRQRFSRSQNFRELKGVNRLEDLRQTAVVEDDNKKEHRRALQAHEPVDVVFTVEAETGGFNYVRVKEEPLFDKQGAFVGYIGCAHDSTETYRLQHTLQHQSTHDELTGLFNRRAIMSRLQEIFEVKSENPAAKVAPCVLTLLDVDHFKAINDDAGHHVGDQMLIEIAACMRNSLPKDSLIARMGGDEFAVLIPEGMDTAYPQLQQLVKRLCEIEVEKGERVFRVGVSAGVAVLDQDIADPQELFQKADIACYSSKLSGRSCLQSYSPHNAFQARQNVEITLLPVIKNAVQRREIILMCQPIKAVNEDFGPVKFEVLMRLKNAEGDLISPGEVIPIAEKFDIMPDVDLLVFEQAVSWSQRFKDAGVEVELSINLSGATLSDERKLAEIVTMLEKSGVAERLCIEITETSAIKNLKTARQFIVECKEKGSKFSLDDFGSGLSSFAYLKELPADYLKIDGSFVSNVLEDSASQAIVKSFSTLAHELGMHTIAEFVETDEIADYLSELDIDYLQGYGVGRPEAIENWYEELVFGDRSMRKAG